jgi:hypothetical protein
MEVPREQVMRGLHADVQRDQKPALCSPNHSVLPWQLSDSASDSATLDILIGNETMLQGLKDTGTPRSRNAVADKIGVRLFEQLYAIATQTTLQSKQMKETSKREQSQIVKAK